MNKVFTSQEQEELNKASNALNLDADTKKQAFTYFLEYKQKTKQSSVEKLTLIIGCSIFCAAKSQVLTTVKGDTIRGVGISITQLLRGLDLSNRPTNIEDFLMALKDFITIVTLTQDISLEMKGIIDKFAFSYTFFIKFNNLLDQLGIEQTMGENDDYVSCLKNMVWLIYVNARSSILQNRTELVESVFLLAATLIHMLYNLPEGVTIPYFEKNGKNIYIPDTNKRNEEAIKEGVLELLKLNNSSPEEVLVYQKSLNELLKKFLENDVLRSSHGLDFEGIYDAKWLFMNFEKLSAHYQKKLGFDDLDERFFIRDRKAVSVGMFTPFAKQGAANKLSININITKNGDLSQSVKKTFSSQRMLTYEESEQVSMKSNLNEIKFATNKSVPASPLTKIPPATPVTRALEMYNWLSDKVKIKKNNSGLTATLEYYLSTFENRFKEEIITRANTMVEKVLTYEKENAAKANNPLNEKKVNDRHNQMVSLYFKVLEELLSQEQRKTRTPNYAEILSNENFHKALIACSIETVFFVNNSTNVTFGKLLELCDLQAFEFWKIIGSFAKFDPQIPFPIKKHLHSLEMKILMYFAWKKDSALHKIIKKLIEESKADAATEAGSPTNNTENALSPGSQASQPDSYLSSSLTPKKNNSNVSETTETLPQSESMKQSKTELTHSQELFFKRVLHHTALHVSQLSDLLGINDKIAEQVWTVMKYILSSETTLLIDRHIDQIILSTIYGVCKVLHQPIKFQEIITKYQELPSFDKSQFIENIHQVYINENEKADLIKFYNTVYINQMKTYLFSLAPSTNNPAQVKSATPQVKKPLVPALVMDSPLRESLPFPGVASKSMSVHNKSSTPFLKCGMTPRTGALYAFGESPSRTLETINNLASKIKINFDDHDNSNPAGDAVIKKVKPSNSILGKIIEQRGEDSDLELSRPSVTKMNLFGSDPATNKTATLGGFGGASQPLGLSFPKLPGLQIKANKSNPPETTEKMNVENDEQTQTTQPPQSQSQSLSLNSNKTEQSGFKKVQKKDSNA